MTPKSPSLSFSIIEANFKKYPNETALLPVPKDNIKGRRIYEMLSPSEIIVPANSEITFWTDVRIHTDNYSMCPLFLHNEMVDKGLTSKYIMVLWDHYDDGNVEDGGNVPFIIKNPTNSPITIYKNEKVLFCTNGDIYPAY